MVWTKILHSRVSYFRTVEFYRSPGGREVAIDGLSNRLTRDGDLFRQVREAVRQYDRKQGRDER